MKNNSEIILERILNRQISARIVNLIADKGITPYQVMKDLDLPKASFYNCINSERDWSIDNLIKLSDYFKVSLDYLICGEDKKARGPDLVKLEQLEEENRRLRDSISQITALTQAVEIKKKIKRKSK